MITRYREFLADEGRVEAYRRAIFETVRPGDTVIDLGCGLGTCAFFAAQAGAKTVYAIESGPVIEVARQLSKQNGLADRIEFFRSHSAETVLPKKADLVVTEIFGPLFVEEGLEATLLDARDRWLKPGGSFLPSAIDLFLAPIESPKIFSEIDFWNGKDGVAFGLDFLATREMALNSLYYPRLGGDSILSEPVRFRRIDLNHDRAMGLDDRMEFTVARPGILHGFGGWLDMTLSRTVRLTNIPSVLPAPSWGHLFFPIERPETVFAGDRIVMGLRTTNVGEALVWNWDVEIIKKETDRLETGRVVYRHSTFKAIPMSREELHRSSLDFIPDLSDFGQDCEFILARCDGKKTTKQLAEEVCRQFPKRYPTIDRAAAVVFRIISKYAR